MNRSALLALILAGAILVCLSVLRPGLTQSGGLRRITNTTEEGINLNPSISGDGKIVAFESTEDVAGAGGSDHFRAIRANIGVDPATFFQMTASRAVAPAISQDGSRIAFASKDDPLGTNLDGNSEIFLFDGAKLIQVTNTSPGNLADRVTNGNFQPSISDDGRFIAFSSNRDLAGQNTDGNLEIFVYDTTASNFTQLTNSSGIVGFSDAKISGDGATVAYIRDSGATPSTARDLLKQPRVGPGPLTVLASAVPSLAMTYGRAISDDGARVVYSAQTATNVTQVFLFDGRAGGVTRQITSLGSRVTEVPLHPTISGDGSRIAFAARRSVSGAPSNSDGGVELYVHDLPTGAFSKITNAPSSATADVVSSLSDDGSIVAFSFPRILSGAVANSDSANNSEIYATAPPARPANGTLTAILNGASFGHEPSSVKAVAPDSIVAAQGSNLANTTQQSQRLANGTFPTNVGGTRVTVNGRAAQIFFVSPTQVNFLMPPQTEIGTAEVIVTNSENFPSRGTVPTLRAAPGIFTKSGDGLGEGMILNADTLQEGPFDPTGGNLRLSIFATGARNAALTTVSIGGRVVNAESINISDMAGLDEIHVRVPADLRGAGTVILSVNSDGRDSNPVTVTFVGDSSRAILVNEVLADPPDGIAGDANHDGVRDGTQDEFIELVNGGGETTGVGGWTIKTRSTGGTTETTRFTFPAGTSVLPGEALVVFGGGGASFNPNDPIFGCAQVFKVASSSGLSLTNSGLTILVRNSAGNLITQFEYGGSTGLDGGNSQSLTRSPDITGGFVQHTAALNANGRRFSPGLRTDGTPFGNCPGHLTRVTISPSSTSVAVGQTAQFTAQAFDEYGRVMTGVPITFTSDNTPVATVDSMSTNSSTGVATATVTGRSQGTAHIQASATSGGATVNSPQATLSVIPRITRVEVSPASATINRGNTQQFNATAFDQNNQPLSGVTFNWNSSNTSVATIDSSGLAHGVGIGSVTITASTPDGTGGTASQTATLNVQVPLVINEINADVAPDNPATTAIEGDANRDGVRDSDDDEFVELLNNSNSSVDVSGVVIADATSNRFTFPANTILAAGRAAVVFGGGNPPVNDPAFGGARIFTTSSLSLNDTGDTVNVKLTVAGSDVLIASQTYGGTSGVVAPSDQSLTRAPDAEVGTAGGSFVAHNTATNAAGRVVSPGTRADGTPFGSPQVTRIEVTPASARAGVGATQSFIAHAFSNVGGPEIEILNVSFIWDSSDTSKATVAPTTGQTTTATALSAGDTTIRARAGGQQGTSLFSINPTISISDVSLNEGNSGTTAFTFTVILSTPAPAGGVTFDIATQDGTATVADNDYVAKSLTSQSIPAGSQTYFFTVNVVGDTTLEGNETFFVNLTNVSGATVADGQGQGTILDDDGATLSIDSISKNEGDSGATTFTFTVSSTSPAPAGGITFDIATQDDTAVAGVDYIARSLTNQVIPAGQQAFSFDVTVNGDTLVEPNETFFVKVTSANGNPQGTGTIVNDDTPSLVISQVYGGGGNTGAIFKNDFIELYNRGTTTVDFSITPYSVQYASVGSNFGSDKTNLTAGVIPPGKYFLIQEAAGSGGTTNLPTPDATGTIGLAATSGKVALVVGTTALAASTCPGDDGTTPFNPNNANVADFVGYGNTATTTGHCYEGSGPAAAPSNTTGDFRKASGCLDTDNNATDFFVAQPNPRNSASPTGDCKPEIIINDVTVTEGNSGTVNATFTVSLTTASAQTVMVDFATADGTATAPADYQSNNGTLTFNPGDLTKTVTVLVNGDTLDEANETFFVNLLNPVNAVIIDGQGQGTINDNDAAPSLSINDVSVAEGDSGTTPLTFTVTLSTASGQTVTVNYATADNTATAPSDYQSTSGTLTFNPGETTKPATVLVNGDTDFEANETFFVNLSSATNATISDSQGIGTITNDEAAPLTPTFFINDVNIAEGNSGTSVATFTVTLSQASGNTVMVDYATANGTATSGSDYQSTNGTLTFSPGDTSKPISVTINGDTLVEPDETFFINLTNATGGASIGDSQGVGTILNDDVASLTISQVYPGGGLSGATFANDFIELFNRGTATIDFAVTHYSVQFLSTSASTWAKTDLTSGTLAPGHYFLVKETSGGAAGAPLPTADATGSLNITSTTAGKVALVSGTTLLATDCPGDDGTPPFNPANGTVADFVGYGGNASTASHCYEGSGPASFTLGNNTIADFRKAGGCTDTNDNAADFFTAAPFPKNSSSTNNCAGGATPNLTINDVTLTEGNSGTTTATFTVSLSGAAQGADVFFDIATQNNTATAGSDYVARTLTNQVIPAGQTTYTFDVTINGDTAIEPDETFFVNVTNVVGANVIDGQGLGTIQNDDLPALSIDDISLPEGDSGTKLFSFHVTLSAASTSAVTFDIATQDNTATVADNDYVARSLTAQTIPAGSTSYTFDVTVNGDVNIEPNESFFVNVTNVSGATVAKGQGAGTITNDDSPTLTINDVSIAEGNSGVTTATFTVTLSPTSNQTVTVNFATADGTALAGSDYQATSGMLTFSPTESSKQINVTINGDTLVEPDESFFVNLSNATGGATIGDSQGVGTITNDDVANLKISQLYGGGNNSGATFQNDFVEIFNHGTTTVDFAITPYSVQYAGVGSNFGSSKTNLTTGTIAPGKYFLVQESGGATNGAPLPVADATGTISLGSTAGKVALVAGTAALSSSTCPGDDSVTPFNPNDATIADFVGYGDNASTAGHCYEGSAPAPAPSNTTADFRKAGGCTDTNDNAADSFVSTPFPRNSASPANNCAGGATPNLTINDVTVTEGNSATTTATFTVSLSAPAQGADVTFDIATANGTATTANNDYVSKSLTNQIIPAGQTTYTFPVTVNGDTNVEPDETFLVNVTNVAGANVTDGQGQGTIQNDDSPTLSIDDVSATEGDSGTKTFSFHVSLSAPAPSAVTFDIATADGTATTANNDYVARSLNAQTIAQGSSNYTFDVTVNGDQNIEPNETFFVNVSNVSGGATVLDGQGQGTILNDDSPILSVNDVTMAEGNSGTTTFTFTITSSLPAPADITFDITTVDGTAHDHNPVSEDNDYVANSATGKTIAAGTTSTTFNVTVNGDTKVEPDETFTVVISNVSGGGATIGDDTGVGTITNDDTANLVISQLYGGGNNSGATFQNDFVEVFNRGTTTVDFSVNPYSIQYASSAGSFSGTAANFIALNSGSLVPGQYFLVKLAGGTTNGAALPAEDASNSSLNMSATDGKVALVVGTTVATTTGGCPTGVTVADFVGYGSANCSETAATAALSATKSALRKSDGCIDTDNNSTDFTTPTLSAGTPPRNSASATNNCNAPPNLTIDNVTATEGNAGTKLFTFTVNLSKPALAGGVTFDIATADDTASAGSDYVARTLTSQTIAAGQQTYTFDVTVNGDTAVEPDETFFVNVTSVTGATVLDGQGLGTIQNDDTPSLSINDVTANEGNAGTTTFNFTVTLSPASNQTVTVNYATADVTATAGTDYTAIPSTQLTFLAGETTKPVTVNVSGDTTVEPDETFNVNLSGATNANISDSQGVGTITNDDGANVVISQIYAGGGNTGAQFTNDFVELFNRTSTPIDVSNWSIQTATATGTTWTVIRLCPVSQTCTIGANKYYLVQLGSGGAVGSPLPAPDATGSTNFATTGGKAALVTNTTALSGSAAGTNPLGGATCPNANTSSVMDFVGYGNATCFEGATAAPALSNTTADFRAGSGCTDANANSTDFSTAAPGPRNSASAIHTCP